jgi:hypothetical protein
MVYSVYRASIRFASYHRVYPLSSVFRNQLLDHKKPSSQAIKFHVIVALKQFLPQLIATLWSATPFVAINIEITFWFCGTAAYIDFSKKTGYVVASRHTG